MIYDFRFQNKPRKKKSFPKWLDRKVPNEEIKTQ